MAKDRITDAKEMNVNNLPGLGGRADPLATQLARDAKRWVRNAAGLDDEVTVMVTELACTEPDCPPYEVVMAVLRPDAGPEHRKVHCRLHDLTQAVVDEVWSSQGPASMTHSPKHEETL